MQNNFLDDPAFMDELKNDYNRLSEIARAAGKDISEVNQAELEKHLSNFESILTKNMDYTEVIVKCPKKGLGKVRIASPKHRRTRGEKLYKQQINEKHEENILYSVSES